MKLDIAFLDLTRFPDANGHYGRRPISYGILAAYLAKHGYTSASHAGPLANFPHALNSLLAEHLIRLFGLYCDYDNQTEVESAIRVIKLHSSVPVIVGGPQSRVLSDTFLARTQCDYVAVGEGEITLLSLLNALVKHDRATTSIPGLLICGSDGTIYATGEPELLPSLDDIPPNHKLIQLSPVPQTDTLQVLSSRGCPYHCTYCHESSSTVRYRSIPHIVCEIESALAANPDIRKVFFFDNTSTLSLERLAELCDQMQRLRERWDFVWGCESHIHFINRAPELLQRMVDTGLVRLQIGIESGNLEMLRRYRKGITPESSLMAVRSAQLAGVPFIKTNFILGGPEESWESVEDSLSLAKALTDAAPGHMEITTSFLAPYPLSDIATHPDRYGLRIVDPASWSCFDSMTYPVAETRHMSRADLSTAMQRFQRELRTTMMAHVNQLGRRDIKRLFMYHYKYGLNGPWISLLQERSAVARFFELVYIDHAAEADQDLPFGNLLDMRPVRTLDMDEISNPALFADRVSLNPIDLRFLEFSTGKLTTAQLWQEFADLKEKDDFAGITGLENVIRKLTDLYLLTFMEL